MGHLLRRNILTYKAPPGNDGYDLICIHPDSRRSGRQIRVQVKSRLATDCDRGFPVKSSTLESFDYLIAAFMNVGHFSAKRRRDSKPQDGSRAPELITFPVDFIRRHHDTSSSWEKVRTRGIDLSSFEGEAGIEQIARDLRIPYPQKVEGGPAEG
ncbi:MAG: hypothetical protein FJ091_03910 [Deltaproteobacteria bacterium]|nr:hypothetical protein [Deltaproteobacteria bacterium]